MQMPALLATTFTTGETAQLSGIKIKGHMKLMCPSKISAASAAEVIV